jgi:hypothetical protein
VTQELYRLLPTTIHTKIHAKIKAFEESKAARAQQAKQREKINPAEEPS